LFATGNETAPTQLAQCRFTWHSAGSPGWPFPTLKYKYIVSHKIYGSNFVNSTRKLLWFEISLMLIAVLENKFTVLFIMIFRIVSFPIAHSRIGMLE